MRAFFVTLFLLVVTPVYGASNLLQVNAGDKILGNPNAPVTIFEFSSLSCPHCAKFHTTVLPELDTQFIQTGKAKLIVRPFPLNEPALKAAMLTYCVPPEKYYQFVDVLFQLQGKWAFDARFLSNLETIAKVGGVSSDEFHSCMANTELEKQILLMRKDAGDLEIKSTPTFYIGDEIIVGTSDVGTFSAAIQKALASHQ